MPPKKKRRNLSRNFTKFRSLQIVTLVDLQRLLNRLNINNK